MGKSRSVPYHPVTPRPYHPDNARLDREREEREYQSYLREVEADRRRENAVEAGPSCVTCDDNPALCRCDIY